MQFMNTVELTKVRVSSLVLRWVVPFIAMKTIAMLGSISVKMEVWSQPFVIPKTACMYTELYLYVTPV